MSMLAKPPLYFASLFSLVMVGLALNGPVNAASSSPLLEFREIQSNSSDSSTDHHLLPRLIARGERVNTTAEQMVLSQTDVPWLASEQGSNENVPQLKARPARVTDLSLEEIDENSSQLILSLDGPVTHGLFVWAEPDRVVIDLKKAVGDSYINTQHLQNKLIKYIRGGAHGGSHLRIVLDLGGPAYAESLLRGPDSAGHYQLVIGVHQIPLLEREQEQIQDDKVPSTAANLVAHDSSLIRLKLDYPDAPVGSIEAIEYGAGYMLPLSQVFQVLGSPINVHADTKLAEGWFIRKNQNFVLDVSRNEIIVGGQQHSIPARLVTIREREIFVDSTLLGQFSPVSFHIDPALLTLSIKEDSRLSKEDRARLLEQRLSLSAVAVPPPVFTPVPVPVEAVTAAVPEVMPLLPVLISDKLSDDDLIVLQPAIDNEIYVDFIEVYQVDEQFLLPLQALSDLLRFPIRVQAELAKADGWYLSEDRIFFLDVANKIIELKQGKRNIPDQQVYVSEADIFIDSDLLSQWFPIDISVDLQQLMLHIHPEELFPFQLRDKRLKQWARIQQARQKENNYELIVTPYELVGTPVIETNLSQIYRNKGNPKSLSGYSLLAAGDLGYMSSNLYVSGGSRDGVDRLRLSGGRRSDRANLLGPFRATQFRVGDIVSNSIPLVAQSSLGRGVYFSNRPVFQSSEFDATNFVGDALPGWEVELFHNSTLIELQIIGVDGRYEFLKVPILYGNNTFKLVFHGPQGQFREEIKRFNIGGSFLRRGEFNYELSIDEKSKSLLGVGNESMPVHPVKTRIVGEVDYGISRSVVGSFGAVFTPLEDGEHHYLTAGLKTGLAGVLVGLDTAYDNTAKGQATKLFALASAKKVSIKVERKLFDQFHSEEESDFNWQLESESGIDLYSVLPLPLLGDFNVGINASVEKFDTGDRRTHVRNRISKGVMGVSFSNLLEKTSFHGLVSTVGQFSLRGYYSSALIRTNLNYSLEPESTLNDFGLSIQQKIYQNMLAVVGLTKGLGVNRGWVLTGTLSKEVKKYRLALSANVDNDDNIAISANVLFSLGKHPVTQEWYAQGKAQANNGSVLANVYLDKNLNKAFDGDDEVIDHAAFLIDKKRHTTDVGYSFATGLSKDRYVQVKIDSADFYDSLWESVVEGYKVFPRPAVVTSVSFPVVTASEIEGVVYLIDNEGAEKIVSRVEVQLIDVVSGDIVKRFKSEYDGYYLFEKIPPGEYLLRIRGTDLEYMAAVQSEILKINIGSESDVYSGYDIRLKRFGGG